ncbi:hypothetical protein BDW66DRAFT_5269 [Aspergillus desertorum]
MQKRTWSLWVRLHRLPPSTRKLTIHDNKARWIDEVHKDRCDPIRLWSTKGILLHSSEMPLRWPRVKILREMSPQPAARTPLASVTRHYSSHCRAENKKKRRRVARQDREKIIGEVVNVVGGSERYPSLSTRSCSVAIGILRQSSTRHLAESTEKTVKLREDNVGYWSFTLSGSIFQPPDCAHYNEQPEKPLRARRTGSIFFLRDKVLFPENAAIHAFFVKLDWNNKNPVRNPLAGTVRKMHENTTPDAALRRLVVDFFIRMV